MYIKHALQYRCRTGSTAGGMKIYISKNTFTSCKALVKSSTHTFSTDTLFLFLYPWFPEVMFLACPALHEGQQLWWELSVSHKDTSAGPLIEGRSSNQNQIKPRTHFAEKLQEQTLPPPRVVRYDLTPLSLNNHSEALFEWMTHGGSKGYIWEDVSELTLSNAGGTIHLRLHE